jgi:ribokinase
VLSKDGESPAATAGVATAEVDASSTPALLVLGSVNFDLLLQLPRLPRANDRLSPISVTLAPGGMGGNVATAFARLGGRARYTGSFAPDADGAYLRNDLAREGVDVAYGWVRPQGETARGLILVGGRGERAMVGLLQHLQAAQLVGPDAPDAGCLPAQRGPHLAPEAVMQAALARSTAGVYCPGAFAPALLPLLPPDLPFFVDVEERHLAQQPVDLVHTILRRAAVVFGNEAVLDRLATQIGYDRAVDLSADVGGVLVVTLGDEGCLLVEHGDRAYVPGMAVESVDTTGAGDCFAAAFIVTSLRGAEPRAAAHFANAAAALSTRAIGARTAAPTGAEVERLLGGSTIGGPAVSTGVCH